MSTAQEGLNKVLAEVGNILSKAADRGADKVRTGGADRGVRTASADSLRTPAADSRPAPIQQNQAPSPDKLLKRKGDEQNVRSAALRAGGADKAADKGLLGELDAWLGKGEVIEALAKMGGTLTDKEREQRRAAAKARWAKHRGEAATVGMKPAGSSGTEGRQLPGGPAKRTVSSLYSQYRAHKDSEFADVTPEGGRAGFKQFGFKPQRPAAMSEEAYTSLAQAAGATVKGVREQIAAKAQERKLVPPGTTSRDYRAALSHAQRLALHDVGLGSYDFRMEDDAKARLKPLEPFVRYARRRTLTALQEGHKGTWGQFKAEFGEEFADGRVDLKGNTRRRFYPHMELVRAEQALALGA
ncbi:hypothetical protein [Teichococcus vastitatis]|uniref:Uncharacterized protein n=1 Tax=Teichococcus vastitatis TaxID=2307076 RepID=A0ABS9W831_9PROT|nr:hypothetical protein [Pseudoroseomonas vastitatis]MCI0755451.1 hypothetical protein [Pseudoroseomonas vastitatis]